MYICIYIYGLARAGNLIHIRKSTVYVIQVAEAVKVCSHQAKGSIYKSDSDVVLYVGQADFYTELK